MGTYYWLSSTQGQLTHLYTAPDTGHRAQGGSATQADMVPQPQRAGSAEEHAQGNESATEHGGSAAEHAQPVEQCVQQVNSTVKAAAGQAVTVANASNNTTASGGAEAAGMLQCPFSQSAATLGTTGWVQLHTHRQKALCLAAVGVLFRPSSIMFWLPYGKFHMSADCISSGFWFSTPSWGICRNMPPCACNRHSVFTKSSSC